MLLTFCDPTSTLLSLHEPTLSLSQPIDKLLDCCLTFQIPSEQYQHIEQHACFNLNPELRTISSIDFAPEFPITLKISLNPDRLPDLAPYANTGETAIDYLLGLSQTKAEHPLLYTENWFVLSVTQTQAQGEIGYTTLWSALNPAQVAAGMLTEAEIAQALTRFFTDWTEANLGKVTESTIQEILDELGTFLMGLTDISLETLVQGITSTDTTATDNTATNLLSPVLQFFTEDDWQYTKLQGEPTLRMGFQGQNGEWNCYAKVRETQQQFVFYSLCPISITEDKRNAIAQFLTLANYGMTIGNFELDYSDGEIRYKTSIDVEGDRLTPALIKRLVYTNVLMMDEYLPGIKAVIETGMAPEDAIRAVEQGVE
jgi:hypothetical protein